MDKGCIPYILIAIISSTVIEANDELIEIYWKGLI